MPATNVTAVVSKEAGDRQSLADFPIQRHEVCADRAAPCVVSSAQQTAGYLAVKILYRPCMSSTLLYAPVYPRF